MINPRITKIVLAVFSCISLLLIEVQWALGQSQDNAKLIAEAKKEGVVVVYGTMSLEDQSKFDAKFQEKFPFLQVKLTRHNEDKLLPKLFTEIRAGKYFADIIQANIIYLYAAKKEKILDSYISPEDSFYPKQFKEQGYWTAAGSNVYVIAYNTKMVARENIPKSYEDLLKPLWKGKMMMRLSEQWFAGVLQIMGREKGLNYMRELSKQNIMMRSESNAMRAQLIAAGEAAIDPTVPFGAVDQLKKKGALIDWIGPDPSLAIPSAYAMAYRSPHPNAAKLFLDFILSKEAQRIFPEIGRLSVRSDLLQEQGALKDLNVVPLDASLGDRLADYGKLMREVFKEK